MKNKTLKIVAAMVVIILVCVKASPKPQQDAQTARKRANSPSRGAATATSTPKAPSPSAKNAFGKLPLRFEENQGQSDPQVQYIAKGGGYTLFLTSTEAVFRLDPPHSNPLKARQVGRNRSRKILAKQVQKASFVRMKLSGANITPKIEAANILPGTVNYLIGNDPRKWHTKVPTFGTVQLSGVYPGIDLVYYGNQRQLEYDFVVNPGGDPGSIALEFEGAMDVALSSSGDLSLDSPAGKITARKPSLYQVVNGQRTAVEGAFVARQGRKFGVEVKNYDHTKPLVIDPVLVYSSYLSGSGDGDLAMGVAVDSQGCAYITGFGNAVDFPTVGTSLSAAPPTGNLLAFVSKLNQNGTELVYSTYLGGTTMDATSAIAVDWKGQAYVVGATVSADFPVTPVNAVQVSLGPGATWNAFLAKLTADGQSLLYSTYLGGAGDDEAMGVAVDANENAFVTGYASSSGFPVTTGNAFQPLLNSVNGNAFVTRIDTTQGGTSSLVYSTFLGGSSPYSFNDLNSGDFGGDAALGIAIDSNQNAYVVGEASSTDFPITSGKAYQTTGNAHNSAFLARLDTNQAGANSLVYSTFLGGTGSYGDVGYGIALDLSANAYITGSTFSIDFPVTIGGSNSAAGKAFVARFNTNLAGTGSLSYSTLVGGSGGDGGDAIAVDPDGDAYVGGFTESSDFPVTANAVQLSLASGSANGVVFALSPDGSNLIYGTYFGGSSGVYSVALDSSSNLYFAGSTTSDDLPTTQGAFQGSFQGSLYGFDGFVTEVSGIVTTPQISSIFPSAGGIGSSVAITGSSFGNSQGQSFVSFNGVQTAATSWSDSQIVAPVPSGATTGPVRVTVNNTASNGGSGPIFTVATPPSISSSVSPIPNAFGWNSSSVTVTFTCTAGSGAITNCPSPSTISSEGANQIVSGTATDANGLTATTSVTLNIDKTQPTFAVTSPTDGTGFSTAPVTVSGAVSDALSGVSSATCNGSAASISGGNFSCNISLTVGVNLIMVRVTDLAGNVAGSNFHVTLAGTLPPPNSLQITPTGVNMLVGETRQFGAVDEQGRLHPEATWSVSDSSMATISTDGSSGLTALAAGQVTLTGSVGSTSAQTQVTILSGAGAGSTLPPGTVLWSAQPISGLRTWQILQAVPTSGLNPDLYTHEVDAAGNAIIRAFTSDGVQLWQDSLGQIDLFGAMSDGQGGFSATIANGIPPFQTSTLSDFDGSTGTQTWSYASPGVVNTRAVGQNGTIFLVETTPLDLSSNFSSNTSTVVALDPNTGAALQRFSLPSGLNQTFECNGVLLRNQSLAPAILGNMAVDSDGTLSLLLEVESQTLNQNCDSNSSGLFFSPFTSALSLFQLKPDGTTSLIPIHSNTIDLSMFINGPLPRAWPQQVIPDGQGGVLAGWIDFSVQPALDHVTHQSSSSQNDYSFPSLYQYFGSMVLGDNGAAYATDTQTIQAFDVNSGLSLWTYVSQAPDGISIIASSKGGGLITEEFSGPQTGTETLLDATGTPSPATTTPDAGLLSYSWTGAWHNLRASGSQASGVVLPFAPDDGNLWATPLGNPSENGFASPLDPSSFQSTDSAPPSTVCPTCQLSSPNCNTMPGILPTTYLILVGDPGLNVGSDPTHQHNLGDLLNLAAQQKANELNQAGAGNWVAVCRVSSVQDFEKALTEVAPGEVIPGQITGGVYYFGHSAVQQSFFGGVMIGEHSILAPGEGTGIDTNIGDSNVIQLRNIELGPNVTITLNGCNAGAKTPGYQRPSIAQLIAAQLQRPVSAYDVGVYFSHQDSDHDSHYNGLDLVNGREVVRKVSWGLPMYAVPLGDRGHKPSFIKFPAH